MAKAIVAGMENERDKGNLELGRVSDGIRSKQNFVEMNKPVMNSIEQKEFGMSKGLFAESFKEDSNKLEEIDNFIEPASIDEVERFMR